ncbi:MAG: S-layer homology domain-containing protein [Candidatus Saganbacteria bacterium]|nr:S-layer homology domain-containing protein [Candidatus Saganbacteria bacterium]
MRTFFGILVLFGIWILSAVGGGFSAEAMVDIGEIGVGARTLGMGSAFVGGVDDASSIFTNPASLVLNPNLNILSMSGQMLMDVNYLVVGAADTSPIGRVGIGYVNASLGSIGIIEVSGSGSTETVVQTGTTDYSSSIIIFSYGSKLSRFLRGRAKNISLGANLKYFLQGFSGGGSVMQDAQGTGMELDFGLLYEARPWAKLGLLFNNCLPSGFGGGFLWKDAAEIEGIPMRVRLGTELKLLGESALRENDKQSLSFLTDYEIIRESNWPSVWHLGLEYWPLSGLAIRCGLDQKPAASEAGIGVDNNLTAGVGINYRGFTFDYAYHQFGELAQNATHFFSFGYRGIKKQEEEFDFDRAVASGVVLPEVAPKPTLVTFSDVADDYWAKKPIEYLATLGIMGGYPDKTFRPERVLSRGELATLLVKAKDTKVDHSSRDFFFDVRPTSWVAPYIETAVEKGYMKGYPNGTFRPNQRITRAEAAMVFSKFGGLYVKEKITEKPYPDVVRSHWASPAIAAGKYAGFFEYVGSDFDPDASLSRAEAAEILAKTPFVKKKIESLIYGAD